LGTLFFALSLVTGVLCVTAASLRLWRMSEAALRSEKLHELLRELQSARPATRRANEADAERLWLEEVLAIENRELALAALNERLADVARDTHVGSNIPHVSARIALTAGTALAILELLRGVSDSGRIVWAISCFGVALCAALISAELGRLARRRAREQIDSWNRLARALAPQLAPAITMAVNAPARCAAR
jgi:hypothetical protein